MTSARLSAADNMRVAPERMGRDELAAMIAADDRHWWYRGRRRVLRATLDRLVLPSRCRILDAGCGSGRTLDELATYGDARGIDVSELSVAATRERGHDAHVAAAEELPFPDDSFELVTCLDVIEHTDDDRTVLRELRRVATPGGVLVITVPAHPSLWSAHDEANHHCRRYTRRAAFAAAAAAGWTVGSDTYFNAALLAPAAAVRLVRRGARGHRSELSLTPAALDGVLEWPSRAESALLRAGGRVPVGLSLLLVLIAPDRKAPHRPASRASAKLEARSSASVTRAVA